MPTTKTPEQVIADALVKESNRPVSPRESISVAYIAADALRDIGMIPRPGAPTSLINSTVAKHLAETHGSGVVYAIYGPPVAPSVAFLVDRAEALALAGGEYDVIDYATNLVVTE